MGAAPHGLQVEHLGDHVLGLGERTPRLSWLLPAGSQHQVAYEVEVNGHRCGRVVSDRSVLVPWPASSLPSRRVVEWRVRVWTDVGATDWSPMAWFETALLAPGDWTAEWIEPLEPVIGSAGNRPAHRLRRTFDLSEAPTMARLYITAHGIYEAFLNGRRVGDFELTPGFTSYRNELNVQTFDVGALLLAGRNVWDVELTDGWYRGVCGNAQTSENYGERVALLAQLHADDQVVTTDAAWQSGRSPITGADLMKGQSEDHRLAPGDWSPVAIVAHDFERLTTSPGPPTRRMQELRPASVRRLDGDRQIVDLGQNINGWLRLTDLGPADTEVTLVHGEARDVSGDVTVEHLEFGDRRLGQIDRVISAGIDGDVFEPRHTTHGFQYVRVTGHPHDLTPDDVMGIVVHSDLRPTGTFRCSDARINRLHEIADWSFRDNACDIPTDCPQRERSGFTGDWQIFLPSAAFLYDVAGFTRKWLRAVASDQLPDGCITTVAPDPRRDRGVADGDLRWMGMLGSAGWGDAVVSVPWDLHRIYGDKEVLAEMWPAMVGWVEYAARSARTKRHAARAEARPEPAPHEEFLWDGGWHWGEWLEPGGGGQFWADDQGPVATAFLYRTSAQLAGIGRLLGHHADADRFDELAARALDAWRTEYLAPDGSLTVDTQANHVRALDFGLVPDELRVATALRLVELIREADNHLGTGFLATPALLPVLADSGHLDVAYDLLFQDSVPSWLAMVERGATTVWESWEGMDEHGAAHESLNHYSKGAVIAFLHSHVGGVRLLDGHAAYRRFLVAPQPGGGLTSAAVSHRSPYGLIESSWRVREGRFELTVTVPPGAKAEVILPDGRRMEQSPGSTTYHSHP